MRQRDMTDADLECLFDEWLDDAYGDVTIAGLTYSASFALQKIDAIAYACAFSDWLDSNYNEDQND
jgi:hypothetical protein